MAAIINSLEINCSCPKCPYLSNMSQLSQIHLRSTVIPSVLIDLSNMSQLILFSIDLGMRARVNL